MIKRGLATFIKEFKLLKHDRLGILVLFAMPILLILIMTVVQYEAYKSLNEAGIPVLLVDNDQDSLSIAITKGFDSSKLCQLTVDDGSNYPDDQSIRNAILRGEFLVAVKIPQGSTQALRDNIGTIMDAMFEGETYNPDEAMEIVSIPIVVDPIARKSFVMAITFGLREFIGNVKTGVLFQLMGQRMQEYLPIQQDIQMPTVDFFVFEEKYAIEKTLYQPNAVQHNVPAWAIFAIFFITVPLAASIILERAEGLYIRMRAFPGSYLSKLSGKLIVYIFVAMIQFLIILLIGKYLLPVLGLPELYVGEAKLALVSLALAVSFAAIGYGLLLGTIFNTPPQSSIFGGVSILIMSALGGIWVPVNIMPPTMQDIAAVSPLNWGLSGFYDLFLKEGTFTTILPNIIKLVTFFIVCLFASVVVYQRKRRYQ